MLIQGYQCGRLSAVIRCRHTAPTLLAALVAVVAASGLMGCGNHAAAPAPDDVRPVNDLIPTTTTSAPIAPSTTVEPTRSTERAASGTAAAWAAARDVLGSYGTLLGELVADPAGAPDPGTEARARWDGLVVPGSPLSEDLLARMDERVLVERAVIVPGDQGVTYRHHPTAITQADDAVIEFDWCAWSPGIGTSIDSGDAVDDAVAHATGTGRLVRTGPSWQLAALDQFDLELLEPGAADPCPTTGPDRP